MVKLPGPMPLPQHLRHDLAGHGRHRRAVIARLNAFLLAQVNVAQQIPGLSCAYLGKWPLPVDGRPATRQAKSMRGFIS